MHKLNNFEKTRSSIFYKTAGNATLQKKNIVPTTIHPLHKQNLSLKNIELKAFKSEPINYVVSIAMQANNNLNTL